MEKSISKNQFVIHEHTTANGTHWDLMLENEAVLWTWRLETHPADIHSSIAAERIFDHPLKFLTYEGPVQNNTASVTMIDKGVVRFHQTKTETITCEFEGRILKGLFVLGLQKDPMWTFTPATT